MLISKAEELSDAAYRLFRARSQYNVAEDVVKFRLRAIACKYSGLRLGQPAADNEVRLPVRVNRRGGEIERKIRAFELSCDRSKSA
jgi:hypothetical protein